MQHSTAPHSAGWDPPGWQRSPGTGGLLGPPTATGGPSHRATNTSRPPSPPGRPGSRAASPTGPPPAGTGGSAGGSHLPAGTGTFPAPGPPPQALRGRARRRRGSPLAHTWGSAGAGRGEGATHTLQQAPPLRRHLAAAASSFPPPFSSRAPAWPPPSGGGRALRGGRHVQVCRQGEVAGQVVAVLCHPAL